MLNEIKEKLETVCDHVSYGLAPDIEEWNYIIYGRRSYKVSDKNNKDATEHYFVAIVHEDYIPEDMPARVIEAMTAIPGMRVTTGNQNYHYAEKGGTDMVVELLELEFSRVRKGR